MLPDLNASIEELNQRLIEEYRNDTELFSELKEAQRALGLLFGDRPTCPLLRPHFMERRQYERVKKAAELVVSASEKVTRAALEDDVLLSKFDLTDDELTMVRHDPGYDVTSVSSRLDTFISGNDFKFLEYNAETPAGVGDQTPLEIVLGKIPLIKKLLSENDHYLPRPEQRLLQALFMSYREAGGKKSKPNIAIMDWEGVSTEPEFHTLKDYFESRGFRTLIVDPGEVVYENGVFRASTFEIDIVYKRVLIHEFLEKYGTNHPLVDAYLRNDICLANSFRVKIPHKKALFAVLTDPDYSRLFSASELEAVRNHLPWTRKLEDAKTSYAGEEKELLSFIRNHRERFLIKPNDDYGGEGLVLGWSSTESEWDEALQNALTKSFIVQERADIGKQEFPVFDKHAELAELLVDFDPFLFHNEVEGGMVRLSSSDIVNVTQGGGQTALVILE